MIRKLLLLNKEVQGLRGLLIVLFMSINALSFSQQKINIVNQSQFEVRDTILGIDTIISKHNVKDNAIESLINYTNSTGRTTARIYGQITRVDVTGNSYTPIKMKVIDTVKVLAFNYGNVRADTTAVINEYGKIVQINKPTSITIPYYSFTARLERTKSYPEAETDYKLIDIPFYFYKSDSILETTDSTVVKSRTFGSKMHCIRHFVNGIEIKGSDLYGTKSCNPGSSTYAGGSFRHTNTFRNLDRSIDNLIRVEALNVDIGKTIGSREFFIYKL